MVAPFTAAADHATVIANFALASCMVGLTVTIHFGGLLVLMWVLRTRGIASVPMKAPREWRG